MRMLWVDDLKRAPYGVEVARTYDDALTLLLEHEYHTLYLDHDLGDPQDRTGYDLLMQLIERQRVPEVVLCISMNTVGRKRIADALEAYRQRQAS